MKTQLYECKLCQRFQIRQKRLHFLLCLICISLDFSHCMLHQVLLASPLGTLSDLGSPMFQHFAQIISFLLGLIVSDLQWWIQLSVVWQYHRSSFYIEWAAWAFVAPPVGYTGYKMFWWYLYISHCCVLASVWFSLSRGMPVTGVKNEFYTVSLDIYTIQKNTGTEHDKK